MKIAEEVERFIVPKINSAYPNIINSIKILSNKGYILHTASGSNSRMLNMYLEGMGVRQCFTTLYGSDLINTMKVSKEYYIRIFDREKIKPDQAIIIDDNVNVLNMAKQLGAEVIQSCVKGTKPEFDKFYVDSKELPEIISKS
jgi:HAD superfamily hydrolase (TIGR01509 family)